MRCTSPRTVGFLSDGKTISWSPRKFSKEYATFQLPCGKCIECRLDYARQWAIRCVHEAQMHKKNAFITLTYDNDNLKSPKLDYEDFQKFMKKLRKLQNEPIGMFVTGEYGEQTKRPHWHAIIFNWEPNDKQKKYVSESGDTVYTSETLTKIWGKGNAEFGSVTFESAGYCARYAAKKLIHGPDESHDYHPISKKSSKHAIGKKWLETYWRDIFTHGKTITRDGKEISTIPRYYEKWLQKNQNDFWKSYVTQTKQNKIDKAATQALKEQKEEIQINDLRRKKQGLSYKPVIKRIAVKREIQKQKFQLLQSYLKNI